MQKLLSHVLQEVGVGLNQVNWKGKNTYANFLAQTFYFVSHSTRLLALAASRFPMEQDQFFKRFTAHIGEEKNHERIALTDLKHLGCQLEQFPEMPETRAFYEAQYYKIEHLGPTALLGYILFLEAIAVESGPRIYQKVVGVHGEKAAHFLKVHIEEDQSHVGQAIAVIEQVSPRERQIIQQNLVQSAALYHHMMIGLERKAQQTGAFAKNIAS
jgi:uncharacterized ferritin-like protein (DUF455 family)